MKTLRKNVEALCPPAYLYFMISVLSMIIMMIQNLVEGRNILCLGEYKCETNNVVGVFFVQSMYILLWTKILDMLCKRGMGTISWFLVLFPYILMFVFIGLFMLNLKNVQSPSVSNRVVGFSVRF